MMESKKSSTQSRPPKTALQWRETLFNASVPLAAMLLALLGANPL